MKYGSELDRFRGMILEGLSKGSIYGDLCEKAKGFLVDCGPRANVEGARSSANDLGPLIRTMSVRGSEEFDILLEVTVRSEPDLAARTFVRRVEVILEPVPPIGVHSNVGGRLRWRTANPSPNCCITRNDPVRSASYSSDARPIASHNTFAVAAIGDIDPTSAQ